jgi:hypothetical protein
MLYSELKACARIALKGEHRLIIRKSLWPVLRFCSGVFLQEVTKVSACYRTETFLLNLASTISWCCCNIVWKGCEGIFESRQEVENNVLGKVSRFLENEYVLTHMY